MMTVKMFLEEQEKIPWPALEYVIGQINYGGRVTDDLDRRCIMSILRKYIAEKVLDDSYMFTPSGTYYAPPEGALEGYREYLHHLPASEAPEVFGMHMNANITFQLQVGLVEPLRPIEYKLDPLSAVYYSESTLHDSMLLLIEWIKNISISFMTCRAWIIVAILFRAY